MHALTAALRRWLGIPSPSDVYRAAGEAAARGIADGIVAAQDHPLPPFVVRLPPRAPRAPHAPTEPAAARWTCACGWRGRAADLVPTPDPVREPWDPAR